MCPLYPPLRNLGLESKWGDVKLGRLSGLYRHLPILAPGWLHKLSSKSSRLIPLQWRALDHDEPTRSMEREMQKLRTSVFGLALTILSSFANAQSQTSYTVPQPVTTAVYQTTTQVPLPVVESIVNEVIVGAQAAPGFVTTASATSVTARPVITTGISTPVVYSSSSFTTPSVSQLERLLLETKAEFNKEKLPKLEPAKAEVQAAVEQIEKFIVVDSENGKRWSSFLRLPEIKDQLNAKSPTFVKLLELEMNMRQNYAGLELPQYTKLREALLKMAQAARFHNKEDQFIKLMSEAVNHLLEETKEKGRVDSSISNHLVTLTHNLYHANLAGQQLKQIRGMYASKNLKVIIDESFVQRLAAKPVARPQSVNECILGTRVTGNAFMSGNVSLNLLPMQNGIGFQLDLNACMTSQSKGYNRGIVFNTVSSSPVLATKQVFVSESGVSSPPASVSTQLQTSIQSIEHRSRLVRRIAGKKAAEQKPQSEAVAEGRLQNRVCQEFTEQVDSQVAQAQPRLVEMRNKTFPELGRLGVTKPQLDLSSTDISILAGATHIEPGQLAAPSDCPLPRPANVSAIGQIHESALCNAMATILGGRTIRNYALGDYIKQVTGKVPDDLKDEIEGEEWSITFNPSQPVRIEFDDNNIAITVRIVRMTRGKQLQDDAVSITAKYLPQIVDSRITLTRQGDVEVVSDKNTTGAKATTLRSFLRNKFDKTFKQSIVTEPITLAKLQSRFPQMAKLNFDINRVALTVDQGWMQVATPL